MQQVLLAHRPNCKLEDRPLSAVHIYLLNTLTAVHQHGRSVLISVPAKSAWRGYVPL